MLKHMCVLLAATALGGCGWFGKSGSSPLQGEPLRPGVDRQTTAAGLPPAPQHGAYDTIQSPVDEGREPRLGMVVAPKGGQKAQLERREKDERRQAARPSTQNPEPVPQSPEPPAQSSEPTPQKSEPPQDR